MPKRPKPPPSGSGPTETDQRAAYEERLKTDGLLPPISEDAHWLGQTMGDVANPKREREDRDIAAGDLVERFVGQTEQTVWKRATEARAAIAERLGWWTMRDWLCELGWLEADRVTERLPLLREKPCIPKDELARRLRELMAGLGKPIPR
jgi:hypothetical protein